MTVTLSSPYSQESPENTSLVRGLFALQKQEFTGVAKVSARVIETGRSLDCFLFFFQGDLVLAERKIPTPIELVRFLAQRLKIGYLDSLMEYISHRVTASTSVYQVMEVLVGTRVMSWEDIERVVTERITIILEQFLPYVCKIQLDRQSNFDLAFGVERHGIPASEILQVVAHRQKHWKQYTSIIPSVDAIPKVREHVLSTIQDEATRQHLQQWGHGNHSLAEIAEALGQDPLVLAPLYCRWTLEKKIDFYFGGAQDKAKPLPVILSVDDSPIVQKMINRSLNSSYEVISASSAMEALGILNQVQVDLILLDVTMPEIDGLEFCRTIRKINRFKDTPVIMLTAKDGLIDRAMGHMAGTNRYLTKPIDKEKLLLTVKEFV